MYIPAIDAGHGGFDPGAVGRVLREKDITLKLSLKLHEYLKSKTASSILVRKDDTRWPLLYRAEKINESDATHLISFHVNSFSDPIANGVEVFTSAPGGERTELARKVQNALVKATGLRDRGVKHKPFYILREVRQPAILVELGFISNSREHDLLMDEAFLDRAVKAVGDAYLDHVGFERELEEWEKIVLEKNSSPDWVPRIKDLMKNESHPLDKWWPQFVKNIRG